MPNVPIVIRTEIQKAVFQVMKAYEGGLGSNICGSNDKVCVLGYTRSIYPQRHCRRCSFRFRYCRKLLSCIPVQLGSLVCLAFFLFCLLGAKKNFRS